MSERKSKITNASPEKILSDWAKANRLNISELGRALGYQSNHLQLVVGPNQKRQVNFDLIGRLLYTFGTEGPALEMAEAMKAAE